MKRLTSLILSGAMLVGSAGPLASVATAQNGYYNGMRGRQPYNDRYDRRHKDNGIGPGKGAAIGVAGGAILGAVFGGGLKGAVIGGAAGAGVGALAGKAAQDSRKRDYRERYDRYGHRY